MKYNDISIIIISFISLISISISYDSVENLILSLFCITIIIIIRPISWKKYILLSTAFIIPSIINIFVALRYFHDAPLITIAPYFSHPLYNIVAFKFIRTVSILNISCILLLTINPINTTFTCMHTYKLSPRFAYPFIATINHLRYLMQEIQLIKQLYYIRYASQHTSPINLIIPILVLALRHSMHLSITLHNHQLSLIRHVYHHMPLYIRDYMLIISTTIIIISIQIVYPRYIFLPISSFITTYL